MLTRALRARRAPCVWRVGGGGCAGGVGRVRLVGRGRALVDRRRYITFAWGQMHWSRLPFPELAKHKTAELIRCAINDRIAQYNGQFGAG